MKHLLGRLLCRIGLHAWVTISEFHGPRTGTLYCSNHRCSRCGLSGNADYYFGDGSIMKDAPDAKESKG